MTGASSTYSLTMPITLELETHAAKEVVDITARVESLLDGVRGGSCLTRGASPARARECAP